MTQTQARQDPARRTGLGPVRHGADIAFTAIAALLLLGVFVQVFLAGAGVFGIDSTSVENATSFDAHRTVGNVLGIVAVALFVASLIARVSTGTVVTALVVAVLTELAQHALADLGTGDKWLGGLHALDGMAILVLTAWLLVTAARRLRSTGGTARHP